MKTLQIHLEQGLAIPLYSHSATPEAHYSAGMGPEVNFKLNSTTSDEYGLSARVLPLEQTS